MDDVQEQKREETERDGWQRQILNLLSVAVCCLSEVRVKLVDQELHQVQDEPP